MRDAAEKSKLCAVRSKSVLWGRVLSDGRELPPSRIEVADGRIVHIEPAHRPSPGDVVVDEDGWIVPGLVDACSGDEHAPTSAAQVAADSANVVR